MTDPCPAHQRRAELAWDDRRLAVPSDPELRARYRLLQSWYREQRLNARHASRGPSGRTEPVGSLLSRGDVARDRSLNFLGDPEILAFAEARSQRVGSEGGAAERGRLFHNMLSSMPMAFSAAAVLASAPDRCDILNRLFGLDVAATDYVTAEWRPKTPQRRVGRTAFDLVARYSTERGARSLLGVEVKYTESPSDAVWVKPDWLVLSESCGWFRPGASAELAHGPTNQLWRNALLACTQETTGSCDVAHLAIVGLAADHQLWALAEHVRSQLADDRRDRLITLTWEDLMDRLLGSSLTSFAGQFVERYLDLSPLGDPPGAPPQIRRSIVAAETQRRRRFTDAPVPEPSPEAMADQVEWGRWLPTVWRAVGDPSSAFAVPARPPADTGDAAAWWSPALHLMLYGLGWPSPAIGLHRWDCAGRPIDDARLQAVEALYGRHLEALMAHLWHGCGDYERVSADLGLGPVPRPRPPDNVHPDPSRAVVTGPNPATGGCDPLHLSHAFGPVQEDYQRETVQLLVGDLGTAGPPRATLVIPSAFGWYRTLHELGSTLPGGSARQGWRVDVVVSPVGHLGTFRQSRRSGRWFSGQHQWHELGIPD